VTLAGVEKATSNKKVLEEKKENTSERIKSKGTASGRVGKLGSVAALGLTRTLAGPPIRRWRRAQLASLNCAQLLAVYVAIRGDVNLVTQPPKKMKGGPAIASNGPKLRGTIAKCFSRVSCVSEGNKVTVIKP